VTTADTSPGEAARGDITPGTPASWPGGHPPTCLITGASHGLGAAVAEHLARLGTTVVITARNPEAAASTAGRLAAAGDIRACRPGWTSPTGPV
jgi:NADPH:quinone reductase-like Zn-dependent oxidoreductase